MIWHHPNFSRNQQELHVTQSVEEAASYNNNIVRFQDMVNKQNNCRIEYYLLTPPTQPK
jgi:hypothetical protein